MVDGDSRQAVEVWRMKNKSEIFDFDREHVFRWAGDERERENDDRIMAGARFSTEDTFPVERARWDRSYDDSLQEKEIFVHLSFPCGYQIEAIV